MLPESHQTNLDVAIIGAGWYGLSAAKTYLKLEPKTKLVIFDKDRTVGGTWARDRIYSNLVAQVEHGYFNYPGTPMPKDGATSHNLVSGDMVFKYLDRFADEHDLKRRIQFNANIENVERSPSGWRLTVNGNVVETSKLIMATGVTSIENTVPFKVSADSIPVIHCMRIAQSVPTIESKEVDHFVIVGAAKSAYDAAYFLCSIGKKVTWIFRPQGGGPMPIMPAEVLGMNTITLGSTRLINYLSPSLMTKNGWLNSFFHRTALGRWLVRGHWKFITSRADKAAGFGGNAGRVEGLRPDIRDASCFWCDSSIGMITMDDFWSTLKTGNITILRDNIDVVTSTGTVLRSGQQLDADYVINCTGWGDHFGFLSPELKHELGIPPYGVSKSADAQKIDVWELYDKEADAVIAQQLPILAAGPRDGKPRADRILAQRRWRLYNRCVPLTNARTNDRSIVILGQIHTTQTPTIAEVQSLWAVAYMLGEINLPEEPTLIKEVAEWNAWTRKRYLGVGERYPYALFDWIPYLDRLLHDMGIKTQRKGNPLADFLTPYGPQCYDGIVDEYVAKRSAKLGEREIDDADFDTSCSASEDDK